MHAELFGDRARVHPLDAGETVFFQISVKRKRCAPVADNGTEFANDEPGALGHVRLGVLVINAVIANLRKRHGDNLPKVGRVGQDLLITRHAGVKNRLARHRGQCAKGASVEHAAVLKCQNCVVCHEQVSKSCPLPKGSKFLPKPHATGNYPCRRRRRRSIANATAPAPPSNAYVEGSGIALAVGISTTSVP